MHSDIAIIKHWYKLHLRAISIESSPHQTCWQERCEAVAGIQFSCGRPDLSRSCQPSKILWSMFWQPNTWLMKEAWLVLQNAIRLVKASWMWMAAPWQIQSPSVAPRSLLGSLLCLYSTPVSSSDVDWALYWWPHMELVSILNTSDVCDYIMNAF